MDNLTQQEMQDALAYARVALSNDVHVAHWSSEHFLKTSLEVIVAQLRDLAVIKSDFLKAMPEREVEDIADQFLAVRALIEKMITFLTTYKTEEHFLDEIDNDLLCAWRGLDTYRIVLANDLAMRNYKRQAETEFANFEHMGEMIANTLRSPDEESTFFPYTSGSPLDVQ